MSTETRICPVGDHPFTYETRTHGPKPVFCTPEHATQAGNQRALERNARLFERVCSRCHEEKASSEFGSLTSPYCRPCHNAYGRERRKINGQQNPEYTRALNLRRYGLSLEQFDVMLAAQDGRCAICRTDAPGGQGWHVDHDHRCCNTRKTSCGRCIRGLLCSRCNIAIGNLRDDPVIIRAALDYVTAQHIRIAGLVDLPVLEPAPLPRKYARESTWASRVDQELSHGSRVQGVPVTEPAPSMPGQLRPR